MRVLAVILCLTLLMGCESLKLRNMGKSGVTTGIAYVVGGTIPAVGVLATAMAYDELIPDEAQIDQIESTEQATAYIAESLFMNALYGFIAFLLISLIIAPWVASKRGYNTAKKKYSVRLNKEVVDQIKDTIKNE